MKILYCFSCAVESEYRDILNGKRPTDRLYGVIELRNKGWRVDFNDRRYSGLFGKFTRWCGEYGIKIYDLRTLLSLWRYDIIVMKDSFSTIITLLGKLVGTPVIYVDALFLPPRRRLKKLIYQLNFRLSTSVVIYSKTQREFWLKKYDVSPDKLVYFPYTIDVDFYKLPKNSETSEEYILSVGRDPGRDFSTLLAAVKDLNIQLKLVTTPRNFPRGFAGLKNVEHLNNVSYEELFQLYEGAKAIVVPLKKNITYPSGIRGTLECLALGKPAILTRTPVMQEMFDEEDVAFVEPENVDELKNKIQQILNNDSYREKLSHSAFDVVRNNFSIKSFSEEFAIYLSNFSKS